MPQDQGLLALTQDTFDTQHVERLLKDPEEFKQVLIQIALRFSNIAQILNNKDTGLYLTSDFLSGRSYFPLTNPAIMRPSIRHLVVFGALPNAGQKAVAHGITVTATTIWVDIYATATDPIALRGLPITQGSPTLNQAVSIFVDNTNVYITTASNYSTYTTCYVVLEYIR